MKNTRKKMLLSSVAMLLVALVALGSATYAWYYVQSTVTAQTTKMKASTSEGLVIRHTSSDTWGTEVTDLIGYDGAKVLSPASMNYGAFVDNDDTTDAAFVGAYGTGTSYTNGTLSSAGLTEAAIVNGGHFLVDKFYVASTNESAATATFSITGATINDSYLNVAVYVGGVLQTVYTTDDATSTSKVAKSGTTLSTGDSQTLVPFTGSAQTVTASFSANPQASNGTEVAIVAFADGYNENCKSSTVNTSQLSVTYSFTKS